MLFTYIIILMLISLFCFFYKIKDLFKIKKKLNQSFNANWYSLWLFIWTIIMIFTFTHNIIIQFLIKNQLIQDQHWISIISAVIIQLLILIYCLIYYKIYQTDTKNLNNNKQSYKDLFLEGVVDFFSSLPIIWLSSLIWNQIILFLIKKGIQIELKSQLLLEVFTQKQSVSMMVTICIMAVILAPLIEEIIFRAFLYRFIKSKYTTLVAIIISSLLFAVLHCNLKSLFPLFLIGLFLAKSYEKTGSVITPIIFHSIFNLNTLILIILDRTLTDINYF